MKKLITILTLTALAAFPLAAFAEDSIESDPAYLPIDKVIDLKAIPPEVDVNLPRFLLKDAISGLTNGPADALAKNGIDIGDLVKDVKLIRVVVIEASKTNHEALEKSMKALRSTLNSKWTTVVNVPESNVGVYAMGDASGEFCTGVAVLINEDNEAVIVNVVGHVSIGKLIKIAALSNKLPKDLLKNLSGATGGTNSNEKPKKTTGTTTTTTNQPLESADSAPKESATK